MKIITTIILAAIALSFLLYTSIKNPDDKDIVIENSQFKLVAGSNGFPTPKL